MRKNNSSLHIKHLEHPLIVILGPTASGKTKAAVQLAYHLNSEIISGDSRQIYRGMNLGTGKDLDEYQLPSGSIPYHLIDIAEAGYKYNIFEFRRDFFAAFESIEKQNKLPILCGGSGLYIEAVTRNYQMSEVPPNVALQQQLEHKSLEELSEILAQLKPLHNRSDTETKRRAIRALEIAEYQKNQGTFDLDYPKLDTLYIGLDIDRDIRRQKISTRLKQRLENGMIDEVKTLLQFLKPEDLIYYGLEYKYLTLYLTHQISYQNMYEQLEIAIHQFAKRQMTWFRGMERRGITIHWINANQAPEELLNNMLTVLENKWGKS